MEKQLAARDVFKERKDGSGKLRVWEWSEDPRILIRERVNDSGGVGFRVVLPRSVTGGNDLFLQSRDLGKAQEIARSKGREFRNSRSTALVLGDAQKIQAATALSFLKENSVDMPLDALAREYVESARHLKGHSVSLTEAAKMLASVLTVAATTGKPLSELVEYAAKRMKPAGGDKTLAELAVEMTEMKRAWKEKGELRNASFRDFDNRAGKIAKDIGGFPLSELTKEILLSWLAGLKLAPRTTKNYRMVLAEMLSYAQQKRYIVDNPLGEFTRQDLKEIEGRGANHTQPSILTPKEAEKLLKAAFANPELDLGAAVVLGLFCGVRTEELKRLTWDAVRLDEAEPFIVIGPEIAKKRRIRNIVIPACAKAWLKRWKRGEKITRSNHENDFQKRFRKLQKLAGFGAVNEAGKWESSWEGNAMRHSFGSYHYAKGGNSIETARLLGHKADDTVLFSHYRALASKESGEAYFNLLPPSSGKIVQFESAG